MAAIVDDRAEDFAARAIRHRMIQKQRGVGMLAAIEQVDAVGRRRREPSPANVDITLIAADTAAARHVEGVETGIRADREDGGGDVGRIRCIDHQPHMLKFGVLRRSRR